MSKFIVSLHQPGSYIDGQAVVLKLHETGSGDTDFISSGVVKLEENKAGSFEFDILPSHTYYSMLRRYIQYISVKEIDNTETEHVVFYGRILSMSLTFNGSKHVTCEGLLANLLDCPVYNPQNFTSAPSADLIFTMLGDTTYMFMEAISAYRNTVRQDIFYGGVNVGEDSDPNDEIDVSGGMSVGDFIMNELVDVYGGFLRMEYEEELNGDIIGTLYWDKDPSMTGYDTATIGQPIQYGVNLLDLSAENGSDEIMTGIVPMWTDENGDTKWTTLVSTDVDDPGTSVYKPEIIGSAGGLGTIGVKAINLPTATTQMRAEEYASGYVNRYCQYDLATVDFDSYTVKAVDLHYIDLGPTDKISLYSPVQILCNPGPYIIGKTLTCTSLEINIDAPETSSYTFEVFRPKASSNDKVLTREMTKFTTGQSNTMHFSSGDNVSY